MSFVSYGSVLLEEIKTEAFSQEPVYDQSGNLLFYRFRLAVSGIYNFKRIAYSIDPAGQDPGDVIQDDTAHASTTALSLQHYLSVPRRHLTYTNFDPVTGVAIPIIDVPGQQGLDLENGPYVVRVDVQQVLGSKSFFVKFAVTCSLNKCLEYEAIEGNGAVAVLSNTFVVEEHLDQDYLSSRIYQGKATFSPVVMADRGTTPDDYRAMLFPPVLRDFHRDKVVVRLSPDNRIMEYQIIDRERPVPLSIRVPGVRDGVVTRIEAIQRKDYGSPGLATYTQNTLQTASTLYTAMMGRGNMPNFLQWGGSVFPRATEGLTVRVWGNRNALRRELQLVAIHLIRRRMEVTGAITFGDVSYSTVADVLGKFVEVGFSASYPWTVTTSGLLGSVVAQGNNTWTMWGFNHIPAVDSTDGISSVMAHQPGPPSGDGVRGVITNKLMAPPLLDNCEIPTPPAYPPLPQGI